MLLSVAIMLQGFCLSGCLVLPPGVMVTAEPGLMPGIMSWSVVLPQSGLMISVTHGATKATWMPGVYVISYDPVGV